MQENNFENQVKDLLYNRSEAAPDVMSKVFEKRTSLYVFRNRLILHKYKIIAAAMLIGVLGFLFINQDKNTEVVNPAVVSNENINASSEQEQESITPITGNPGMSQTDIDSENDFHSYQDEEQNQIEADQQNSGSGATSAADQDVPVLNAQENKEADQRAQLENYLNNLKGGKSGTGDQGPEKQDQMASDEGSDITNTDSKGEFGNDMNSYDQIVDADEGKADSIIVQNSDDTETSKTNSIEDSNIKSNDETLNDQVKTEVVEANPKAEVDESTDEDFPGSEVPKTKTSRFSLSLTAGPGVGSRLLDNGGDLQTIVARDATETQQISFTTELLLNYRVSGNLDAFIGVNYYNRKEKMVYDFTTEVTEMNITSKKVIEHHPVFGTREITVYDTTMDTKNIRSNGDSKNSYKHVYVPLGLRYTLYYNDRLGIFVAANGGLEIMTKASGSVINGQYEEVKLDRDFSRTNVGGVIGASVGASYLLNERITLMGEVRGNLFESPTNNEKYPIVQKDQGYGLMLGLKYNLK
jgi:hypothetical protein